jgi:hypothetical protein
MTSSRRPGRPPLDETDRSVNLHLRVPARLYDKHYELARRARLPLADWLRRTLLEAAGTLSAAGYRRRR